MPDRVRHTTLRGATIPTEAERATPSQAGVDGAQARHPDPWSHRGHRGARDINEVTA